MSFAQFFHRTPARRATERLAEAMRRKWLFVDDEQWIHEVFGRKAERELGVDLTSALSVADARRKLEADSFDAVILDYQLTNGDGVQIYAEIVERWPETDVVFLTGHNSEELLKRVEQIGPAHVFSKDALRNPKFIQILAMQLGSGCAVG